jgi:hypothetical protein
MNVKRSLRNCLGLHKVFDPYGAKNPGISPQVPRAPGFSAKKMSSGDEKEEEKGRAAEGEKERGNLGYAPKVPCAVLRTLMCLYVKA